jgi:hypothetical protein
MKMINILILMVITLIFSTTAQVNSQSEKFEFQNRGEKIDYSTLVEEGFIKQETINPLPPGWDFTTSDKLHIISVLLSSNPTLCGVPIQPGDYIGVFYIDDNGEEACGGAAEWSGIDNVPLIVYGDDTYVPGKDGFAQGETMIWYIYSYSLDEQIFPAVPVYDPSYQSNNKFGNGGLSIVTELDYYFDNDIVLPQGWSGFSSYTETSVYPPFIANVLTPILSDMIIIQDMTKIYFPAAGINTMFLWTDGKGYKIKMAEEAIFPMMGCPVDNYSFSLSTTWNILPVLSKCNVLASELFAPILDKIIVVKEIAGNRVFWPEMGIQTLHVLEPGKAYFMAVTQNTSVTYQECQSLKSEIMPRAIEMENLTPWNDPVETGFTHTIAFEAEALADLEEGDYIGAFTASGVCAGLVQLNETGQNTVITLFGNDVTTPDIDGLADGEEMTFRVFNSQSGEQVNVEVFFDSSYPQSDGSFSDNGLSVVKSLKLSPTGISAISEEVHIFPNPTTGAVEISPDSGETYDLIIQTINGQVIVQKQISGNIQLDLSDYSKGVYVVVLENPGERIIQKLVLK